MIISGADPFGAGSGQNRSFYGLSEKVAFAVEIEEAGGIYEFQSSVGLTELLDDDDLPVTEPGREGGS